MAGLQKREDDASQERLCAENERAAMHADRMQLKQILADAVAEHGPNPGKRLPAYWSGKSSKVRIPCAELEPAIMRLLQGHAVHPQGCSGRDGNFDISRVRKLKIWRVENKVLWRQYLNKAEELYEVHKHLGIEHRPLKPPVPSMTNDPALPPAIPWGSNLDGGLNEALLWHGTAEQNIEIIAKAGMDERVCNLGGMFGAGLYFAQDSCKSGQYAMRGARGTNWFLLCRVLLGNIHRTTAAMVNARRAPDKYDSVVFDPPPGGHVGFHRELVVYDRYQVYPEYIIEAYAW